MEDERLLRRSISGVPHAHGAAPHPIYAVLSGAMIKVSLIAFWRINQLLPAAVDATGLMWLGAGTAVYAVVNAASQSDVKRLLAWHSISQLGYIVSAAACISTVGTAAVSHAAAHA